MRCIARLAAVGLMVVVVAWLPAPLAARAVDPGPTVGETAVRDQPPALDRSDPVGDAADDHANDAAGDDSGAQIEPGGSDEPMAVLAGTVTIAVDVNGLATGEIRDDWANPMADSEVRVDATSDDDDPIAATVRTDNAGRWSTQLPLTSGRWTVVATAGGAAAQAVVTVGTAMSVSATQPEVPSETGTRLTIRVVDQGHAVRARVGVEVREPTDESWTALGVAAGDRKGEYLARYEPWRNPQYRVSVTRGTALIQVTVTGPTRALFSPVRAPKGAPEPRNREPLVRRPVGTGANARVLPIDGDQWARMQGVTWRPGCLSRGALRQVEVNYRGFDGYRHRGRIIVAKAIGVRTARVFSQLWSRRYPIRQIRPVDEFGTRPGIPGGDDRASMAADNTSAFNCRYVVGKERSRVVSPHASARAIDINTWVNPYVTSGSVYPNRYYVNRNRRHAAMFRRNSVAMRIFRGNGCRWGGVFRDYHHFEC